MLTGCYDLHAYCDGPHTRRGTLEEYALAERVQPMEVTGNTLAHCKRQLRKVGWRLLKDGRCFCNHCVKNKAHLSAADAGE